MAWRRVAAIVLCLVALSAPAAARFEVVSPAQTIRLEVNPDSGIEGAAVQLAPHPWTPFVSPDGAASGWGACAYEQGATAPTCVCPSPTGDSLCPPSAPAQASAAAIAPDGVTYTTTHGAGKLEVRHVWSRAAGTARDFVQVEVTVTNAGEAAMPTILYRRVLHLDALLDDKDAILRSIASSHTAQELAAVVMYTHSGGRASALPTDPFNAGLQGMTCSGELGPGALSRGTFYESIAASQPCGAGNFAQVNLGGLEPGASRSFTILHGAAPDPESARQALGPNGADADFYFAAQHATPGSPLFVQAFAGLLPDCGQDGCAAGAPALGGQDNDADGVAGWADNCPAKPNHDQADWDRDGLGDACDADVPPAATPTPDSARPDRPVPDADKDGIEDTSDNCPSVANHDQADLEGDAIGDRCDADMDGDTILNAGPEGTFLDNCPRVHNVDQADADMDGVGDACRAPALGASVPGGGSFEGAGSAVAPPSDPTIQMVAAVVAAVAAVLGGAYVGHRRGWWTLGALALFSRRTGSALLEHPLRQQLVQLIESQPGVPVYTLVERTGCARGTVVHHLDKLARSGLVRAGKAGRQHLYYPSNGPSVADDKLGLAARRVLDAARALPGRRLMDLAAGLGMSYGAAHYHVRQLEREGLVQLVEGAGGLIVLIPQQHGPREQGVAAS